MMTKISTNFRFGVWGTVELMVGRKATKASASTAMVANLDPKAGSWKKTKIPMRLMIQRGMKIVSILIPGYLYIGILKCAHWKQLKKSS